MLTADAVLRSPGWEGATAPVVACQVRLRTDLVNDAGRGLLAELFLWSAAEAAGRAVATDYGRRLTLPRLTLHAYRTWEVLPASELADVVDVRCDDGVWLHRVGADLMDLTCYQALEETLLSPAERGENALHARVLLVHRMLARLHPGVAEADLSRAYGLSRALYDESCALAGLAEPPREARCWDGGARDGAVARFLDAVRLASSHTDLVVAASDLLVERPDLDRTQFVRLAREQGAGLADAAALFDEATGGL